MLFHLGFGDCQAFNNVIQNVFTERMSPKGSYLNRSITSFGSSKTASFRTFRTQGSEYCFTARNNKNYKQKNNKNKCFLGIWPLLKQPSVEKQKSALGYLHRRIFAAIFIEKYSNSLYTKRYIFVQKCSIFLFQEPFRMQASCRIRKLSSGTLHAPQTFSAKHSLPYKNSIS